MQFIDVLRTQSLDRYIQIEELTRGQRKTKRSGIMKVENMRWEKIRHFEYKNVVGIIPCEHKGKRYLYIQVDDREKNFYDR